MADLPDPVTIGVIVGPHGVRGTVRVRPSGSGDHLRDGISPQVAGVRRKILASRPTPKGFLLELEGVGDRPGAASLKGEPLLLDRSELDSPEEGEFYVGDLVGLTAMDEAGERIGEVKETFETAAHEVLVIRTGGEELFVPFTMEHVPTLDLAGRSLVVRPPE
ncbi:16S rRNA processing protein RimM [Rubrobacter tropicus]|uniref:Ribosome maturation factor RimM n=1 Tax=Rubrobacter tropicus TaxID=2653851 RepID=A0A6G8Q942_9ACTN|nr:ribosome maturation factor RimM [Rubrobacter tropicus]QIN82952.1 16S rRNA processing protein RimM [Rubrobacter tropicus]